MGQLASWESDGEKPANYLLTYRSNTGEMEVVLNTRSGFVPPRIQLRNGETGHHVPSLDRHAPDHHAPRIGDRVFVRMTEVRILRFARMSVDLREREDSFSLVSRAEAVRNAYTSLRTVVQMGVPDLIPVTPEMSAVQA